MPSGTLDQITARAVATYWRSGKSEDSMLHDKAMEGVSNGRIRQLVRRISTLVFLVTLVPLLKHLTLLPAMDS